MMREPQALVPASPWPHGSPRPHSPVHCSASAHFLLPPGHRPLSPAMLPKLERQCRWSSGRIFWIFRLRVLALSLSLASPLILL